MACIDRHACVPRESVPIDPYAPSKHRLKFPTLVNDPNGVVEHAVSKPHARGRNRSEPGNPQSRWESHSTDFHDRPDQWIRHVAARAISRSRIRDSNRKVSTTIGFIVDLTLVLGVQKAEDDEKNFDLEEFQLIADTSG